MEVLQNFLENSHFPMLSAFILGLMTAISPCPLATNITAIGYISKDIKSRKKVFYNGLIYTLGRAITYTAIIIGLFMLGAFNFIKILGLGSITEKMESRAKKGFLGVLLLGIVFALAFCPYSAVLYFGMLIPITISSTSGLYLPIIFALATGIPVIIFAWLIAFSVGSIGGFYNKMKNFELWFRRIVAVLFISMGIYYVITIFF
jgi:cytochrome c biogenesis protein CcdA